MGTMLALPQLSVPRPCARSSSTFQSDLHGHPERSCEGKRMTEGWCQSQQTQAGCGLRKWGGEAANVLEQLGGQGRLVPELLFF